MGIVQQSLQELKQKLSDTLVPCVTYRSLVQEILKDMERLIQKRNLTSVLYALNHLIDHII